MKIKRMFPFYLICLWAVSGQAQIQFGNDLDGAAAQNAYGSGVTYSGNGQRTAIGGPLNWVVHPGEGHVRVFERNSTGWVKKGVDIHGGAGNGYSGQSVAMDFTGDYVAVGAPNFSFVAIGAGQVRVYNWTGSTWAQIGLDVGGQSAMDQLGHSVDLSADGKTLVAGAAYSDLAGLNAGAMYVYELQGNNWQAKGSPIPGSQNGELAGHQVSMSSDGQRVAFGAPYRDISGTRVGRARVFDWNGTSWVQAGANLDGLNAHDRFGEALSLSGDGNTLAVASFYDSTGAGRGRVKVYQWTSGTWQVKGSELLGENLGDQFGYSLHLNELGSRIAVGARHNGGNGNRSGQARIYDWTGSSWVQSGNDIDGEFAIDRFGSAIALDSSGNHLIVGAPSNDGGGLNSGSARSYTLSPVISVNLSEQILESSILYPNPFQNQINLRWEGIQSGRIQMFNVAGQLLFQKDFASQSRLYLEPNLKPGLYFIDLEFQNGDKRQWKVVRN